jgi:hypothetical protein
MDLKTQRNPLIAIVLVLVILMAIAVITIPQLQAVENDSDSIPITIVSWGDETIVEGTDFKNLSNDTELSIQYTDKDGNIIVSRNLKSVESIFNSDGVESVRIEK